MSADRPDSGGHRDRLAFRAKARIVSEIGDELISSDGIALYELIKNAWDANAKSVRIRMRTPAAWAEVEDLLQQISASKSRAAIANLRKLLAADPIAHTTTQRALRDSAESAFCEQSSLTITDDGEGMDRRRLVDGFLSLASTLRVGMMSSRQLENGRPTLGSKGVGRFSAKRLGRNLRVDTTTDDAAEVEHLDVDWDQYSTNSELYLDEVTNEIWSTPRGDKRPAGTVLTISLLNRVWTYDDLAEIVREHLSTLMNPFFASDFKIVAQFNDQRVDLHRLQRDLLDLARVRIEGHFDPTADPPLKLRLVAKESGLKTDLAIERPQTAGLGDLDRLGPFDFVWYDFIRNDPRIAVLGRKTELAAFLSRWGGGGPMLFRDGFRVMPYGRPGYDWLEIDRDIYRSGGGAGVHLRTLAFTGYVAISAVTNPGLVDQTNREGLRATGEYRTFVGLLKLAVGATNTQLNAWFGKKRISSASAARRSLTAKQALDSLADEAIDISEAIASGQVPSKAATSLADKLTSLKVAAHSYAAIAAERRGSIPIDSYPMLLELAGLGMAAEQLSHELLAAIDRAESVLARLRSGVDAHQSALLDQLLANLAALRRIASVLTPLTQASRRTRADYDVLKEAGVVARLYTPIVEGRVAFVTNVEDKPIVARLNRGVLIQVFDNLINNSLYWLAAARTKKPKISLVSGRDAIVTYRDNGPGIEPRLREAIFDPFMTTKPDGRGLGLFIARELLEIERCRIELAPEADPDGRIREFRLDFSKAAR